MDDNMAPTADPVAVCSSCGSFWRPSALNPIAVQPGDPAHDFQVGECPLCRAPCHIYFGDDLVSVEFRLSYLVPRANAHVAKRAIIADIQTLVANDDLEHQIDECPPPEGATSHEVDDWLLPAEWIECSGGCGRMERIDAQDALHPTYCGSYCPSCLALHIAECEICRQDIQGTS